MTDAPTLGEDAVPHAQHTALDTFDLSAPRVRTALASTGLALGALAATFLVLDVHSPLRVIAALAFVLFVPGYAVVGLLRLTNAAATFALSTTLSLVLGILVAQLLVWQHSYSVGLTFGILAAVSVCGLTAQLLSGSRDGSTDEVAR